MTRKPLSPEAKAAVQEVMRKFCEDVERPKEGKVPAGVLAELEREPREA